MTVRIDEVWRLYANHNDIHLENDNMAGTSWGAGGAGPATSAGTGPYGDQTVSIASQALYTRMLWVSQAGGNTPSGTVMIVNCWVKFTTDPGGSDNDNSIIMSMTGASATAYHWILMKLKGGGWLVRGQGSGAGTGAFARLAAGYSGFESDMWHHLEIKVDHSNTGSVVMRIDGEEVCNVTGVDTLNNADTTLTALRFGGAQDSVHWADPVVMDGSGSTMNDFKGPIRFETALPTGDGTYTAWTPNSGVTLYTQLDEALTSYDKNTTYVEANLASLPSKYSLTHAAVNLTNATTILYASQHNFYGTDLAGKTVRNMTRVSSTDYDNGADMDLVTGAQWRWRRTCWETNPNTSAAWTKAQINAAEWGGIATA